MLLVAVATDQEISPLQQRYATWGIILQARVQAWMRY
jgi:hypothetical protein